MCALASATDERGLALAATWHGMSIDTQVHAARTIVDKLPAFGYRVQKLGSRTMALTQKQACQLYTSFFEAATVGVDSDGNPVSNDTPAITMAKFLELPMWVTPQLMTDRKKVAVDFLRDLADKIEGDVK